MLVTALCRGGRSGANARGVASSVDAMDVSDKGIMVLCVSAASLKLTGTQIQLPLCIFDAGGHWIDCCGCNRSMRIQMYTEMYTNNRIVI